jgi:diguanylate cyclase (GGDEF)-like protein
MSTSTPTANASVRTVERLLARLRPDRPRRLEGRERRVEQALATVVLAGAVACAVALPSDRPLELTTVLACVVAFALAARVWLYVGGGCALATQLVLVPVLFVLPLGAVPLVVIAALVLAALPDAPAQPHRPLMAVGDAGYVFAPVAVLAAAGEPAVDLGRWELLAGAFAAQVVLDGSLSLAREWLGRGIRPVLQARVMGTVYAVDALLLPAGFLIAESTADQPLLVLATVPLSLLLAALARDRTKRLNAALDRLEELERERDRVRVAIHRTARSLGFSFDRGAMLEVALGTSVDAVAAAAGRARLVASAAAIAFEAVPHQPGAADCDALHEAERAALAGEPHASARSGGWSAMGRPLVARRDDGGEILGAIAVCRAGGPFAREQSDLFTYLAAQTAASIEAIDLHEQLRHPVMQDDLTGLANHRRFRELLGRQVENALRSRRPLSVLVIEVGDLRRINADAGFEAGDEVLCTAAAVIRDNLGSGAEAARLGGGTLAAALAETDLDTASALGDAIRSALAAQGMSGAAGVAELSARLATPEALIAAAEAARDEAVRAGRNRTVGFRGPYAGAASPPR